MNKNRIVIIALCLLVISCADSKKETQYETLMNKTLATHDEVMPKMNTLNTLIDALENTEDSIATQQKEKAIKGLKGAHDFMMEWMSDFGEKFPYEVRVGEQKPTVSKEKRFELLKIEYKEAQLMKDSINNSISRAKKLLGKS